jgi:hypothetical protein
VNSVINAFKVREEKEARVECMSFLVAIETNHLLIPLFSLFVKLLLKCEHVLEHFEDEHDILGDLMIK